jgi:hypothetical protein
MTLTLQLRSRWISQIKAVISSTYTASIGPRGAISSTSFWWSYVYSSADSDLNTGGFERKATVTISFF